MAGDWFPIRLTLNDDPAVIAIAAATGLDEYGVVGRLVKLWAWANEHTADGNAPGVTEMWIDRYLGVAGFASAMIAAGWLVATDDGVTFPSYDRWNSKSAKKRLMTNLRVGKHRGNADATPMQPVGNAPGVTPALPEKRREEKKSKDTPLPPAKPGGGTDTRRPIPEPPQPDFDPTADRNPWFAPLSALLAAWKAARLPGHDSTGGIQETANRRGWWQMRLQDEHWRGHWQAAVERAGRSPVCRGEDPKFMVHGLRLDTFLKDPDLVTRILEGEFDEGANGARRSGSAGRPRNDYPRHTPPRTLPPQAAQGSPEQAPAPGGPSADPPVDLFGERRPG